MFRVEVAAIAKPKTLVGKVCVPYNYVKFKNKIKKHPYIYIYIYIIYLFGCARSQLWLYGVLHRSAQAPAVLRGLNCSATSGILVP